MIISRTPFRISFFGGGTDYPIWYCDHGGRVLGTTIAQYGYCICRGQAPLSPHTYTLRYAKSEYVDTREAIDHRVIRESLRYLDIQEGIDLTYNADLPSMAGLGSSSTFTVSLLHALYTLKGQAVSPHQLTLDAVHLEQDVLEEAVGSQDQTFAAYGGLRCIEFGPEERSWIQVRRVVLPPGRSKDLERHLLLVYTGKQRSAAAIAAHQIRQTKDRASQLAAMDRVLSAALEHLTDPTADLSLFGHHLNQTWALKKQLTDQISTPDLDHLYDRALEAGAIGGKLLGAGGGGFFLFFARPDDHETIRTALDPHPCLPVVFDRSGSTIVYQDETS